MAKLNEEKIHNRLHHERMKSIQAMVIWNIPRDFSFMIEHQAKDCVKRAGVPVNLPHPSQPRVPRELHAQAKMDAHRGE